jgi:hypothetical protein
MYKVTVIDLDTGETEIDATVSCICGGIQIPAEESEQVMVFLDGAAVDAHYAMDAAEKAVAHLMKDPRIAATHMTYSALFSENDNEED